MHRFRPFGTTVSQTKTNNPLQGHRRGNPLKILAGQG
jgi:hypothetical protein